MQIFSYFKIHIHNEGGLGPKRYFQVFFRAPQNLTARQISKWPDTPFRFFANRYPISGKYITRISFLQYFNSSLSVRTGIIIFGSKLSKKTRHLLFKTFESSNAMDSPIVQCLKGHRSLGLLP